MADINLPSITPQYPGQTSLVDVMRGYTDAARSNLDLQTARATQQATIEHAKATADTAQTGAKKARYAFDQSQQQQAAQFASTLAQDPELIDATKALGAAKALGPDAYEKAFGDFQGLYHDKISKVQSDMIAAGLPADKVATNAAHLTVLASTHPEQVLPTVSAAIRSYMSPEAQNATQTPAPAMAQTGSAIVPLATGNAANTGVQPGVQAGPATSLTIGPGAAEQIDTDSQGNKYIVQRDQHGTVLNTRPVPGASAPFQVPPNETRESVAQMQTDRAASNAAALEIPQRREVTKGILDIVNGGDLKTGKLGAAVGALESRFGFSLGGSDAEKRNTLGKLLAIQNQGLAKAMGPNTNAGLQQQNEAGGTTDYDLGTLKTIAQRNQALQEGVSMYNKGLEKAISTGGIGAKRQFDAAWADAADIDALKVQAAITSGDTKYRDELLKTFGGKDSPKALAIQKKLRAMAALTGG